MKCMKTVIDDPETTEQLLKDAGFEVAPHDMGFNVTLHSRKLHRAEVAGVLQCEPDDLESIAGGVLVR